MVGDVPAAFARLVAERAPRRLFLSGGGTARRCYEALAAQPIDWPSVEVWFGDERWVAVDDEESNEGQARRALLDAVPVDEVRSLRGDGTDVESAADRYDALVAALPSLGLVHLGLGPDGHTASLFPGSPALDVTDRQVVATGDDVHPHPRLTLTFSAIARADVVVVTVEGEDKADAWRRVLAGDDIPATRLRAPDLHWLVDPAAAG